MNRKVVDLFIFFAGAAVGSVTTWKLVKDKYKQIADEEIASVKDVFLKKIEINEPHEIVMDSEITKNVMANAQCDVNRYHDIIARHYNIEPDNAATDKEEGGEFENMQNEPYVISPNEFGECKGYKTVSLTYYLDHVLVDEDDEPIEDINYHIGDDALNHFGDYEEDSVFVRNDLLATDYEILLDPRRFYDLPDQVNADDN